MSVATKALPTKINYQTVRIDSIQPHKHNPRLHPDSQIAKLVNSLKEFGWAKPVVISQDNIILAGHGIVEAAKKAGYTEIPVSVMPYTSDSGKAIGYMLADNRIEDDAIDDPDMLKNAINEGR